MKPGLVYGSMVNGDGSLCNPIHNSLRYRKCPRDVTGARGVNGWVWFSFWITVIESSVLVTLRFGFSIFF
ncbi:hypothetical protein HanIR_Chr13g0646841 [Helianthus annuus]|nr:hypothetical protein HanIR_Chr13g0646841 [Helianthus annuus]